jgi:hypothetical protein
VPKVSLRVGLLLALWACGPPRPEVPPVPAPLIGSCYYLNYSPSPPRVGDWSPSDTVHFLSARYAKTIATGRETIGHLARRPTSTDDSRQADWWVTKGKIHLAYRTLAGERLIEFDSLTPPALGRWRQSENDRALTGVVRAEPSACPDAQGVP